MDVPISWRAVRGMEPEAVRRALGLATTGRRRARPLHQRLPPGLLLQQRVQGRFQHLLGRGAWE